MSKKIIENENRRPMTDKEFNKSFAFSVLSIVLCLIGLVGTTYAWYTANDTVNVSDITISAPVNSSYNSFTTVFEHTDKYLYRVGNGNAVALKFLFKVDEPGANDVDVSLLDVEPIAVEPQSSIYNSINNVKVIKNSSDWKESTIKFVGEGPVKVQIREGNGPIYVLNLEIVNGTNLTTETSSSAISSSGTNKILLNDFTLASSSNEIAFSNAKFFGNGFKLDLSAGNTEKHGIWRLTSATLDNTEVVGPVYSTYVGEYNNTYYASTVACYDNCIVSNCRITGASSPLKIWGSTQVINTVLSGGIFANLNIRSGSCTITDVITVNIQNSLGILFDPNAATGSSLNINGTLTQHNFIADNSTTANTYASTLKNKMFESTYSRYQFTSGSRKYVNTGIVSMTPNVGASSIIDNRTDKKNYSGMTASLMGVNGYVYTMENTDPNMLETSYTEPAYVPELQIPYEPVFSWSLGSQVINPGGDTHCYKDGSNISVQFLEGGSYTLDVASLPTVIKYGVKDFTPSVSCKKQVDGTVLPVTDGKVTFSEAGSYEVIYTYTDDAVYDKNASISGTSAVYTKVIIADVYVKSSGLNAVITCTSNSGEMIWGGAGSSWDRDYQPAADIFTGMTITDYDAQDNAYTVLDGSNQSSFLDNIVDITADSDNKTGFTITLADGCTLRIKCGAPYNQGTLQFKKYNNKFYMCGSVAYNNATAATWNVTEYIYTGRNGVAVKYGKRGFTSTTSTSYVTLSNLSSNKVLVLDAQGGSVTPRTTTSSPVTLPTPTRDGYYFKTWNTKADGTGTNYAAGSRYTISATTTLYAIWYIPSVVTFDANGGTCSVSSLSNTDGNPITLPAASNGDYTFDGWFDEAEGGTLIGDADSSYTPYYDITLYAHWSNNPKVTFDANGGTCSATSATYDGTTPVTLPSATRDGYSFAGWYTQANGGTKIGDAGGTYEPADHVTLYAHWTVKSYTVTVSENNGSAALSVNGTTVNSGGSVAYNSVVKFVISYTETESKSFSVKQGNSGVTYYSNEACTTSSTNQNAGTYYFRMPAGNVTITVSSTASSGGGGNCITGSTLITLADGSQKRVDKLTGNEELLVWDLEKGEYSSAPIVFVDSDPVDNYRIIHVCFSDGTDVEVVSEHGFFDIDKGEYVYINEDHLRDYIDDRFVKQGDVNSDSWEVVVLTDVWTEVRSEKVYEPVTYKHLCFYTNNILSMPGGISGLFNIFEVDTATMKYDSAKMQRDIQKYGLLTVEDYGGMITQEMFDAFNGAWLGVAIGKGMLTWEEIAYLANRYAPLCN